jgi:Domain of unknown function (DUF4262)
VCDSHGGCGSCSGSGTSSPFAKLIQFNVRTHGYSIAFAYDSAPGCAYTAGLEETWGHPELIVFGLDPDTADRVLRSVADLVRQGFLPNPAGHTGAEIEGGAVLFEEIDQSAAAHSMPQARDYYGDRPFRALQVIWPGG